MAYITTDKVKKMREEIKSLFPKTFKFSIVREHYSTVRVSIMSSPLKFEENTRINHYYLESAPHKTILRIIKEIINQDNFDKSDLMTDYHHVGHYTEIRLGQWDKPYQQITQ